MVVFMGLREKIKKSITALITSTYDSRFILTNLEKSRILYIEIREINNPSLMGERF